VLIINHLGKAMQPLLQDNQHGIWGTEYAGNRLDYSSFSAFHHAIVTKGFGIKYVVEGIERYTLNGAEYPIIAGQYLLCNERSEGHVEIDSPKKVNGICLNINYALISEILATLRTPNAAIADVELDNFFLQNYFLEHQYSAKNTQLGSILSHLGMQMQHNERQDKNLNIEFFYTLAESVIADQIPVFKQLQNIPSVKSATKKDLYRRILKGKDYIDASYLMPINIPTVAKEAHISEYHFFRLFKAMYVMTPHQYILKKRLEFSLNILKQDKYSVSEAAYAAGYSDIYAFSKAFKKHFGYSPSALL
jgi:AraC family transcriptional regulator